MTLLEVLVSLGVLVMISLLIYGAFDSLSREPFVVYIEPPSIDPRILNQFALFSLMSSPTASLENWLREHPELHRRVAVPADLKWEVRDKLDQANVTERVLFPGLDGICKDLKDRLFAEPV